mmetsp:Transcript_2698/g.3836  ORF Transcript_2698/g.3836 Transcript_2698/m.3836 type:complete len:208 (-) Transcript_2698:336-959(-)
MLCSVLIAREHGLEGIDGGTRRELLEVGPLEAVPCQQHLRLESREPLLPLTTVVGSLVIISGHKVLDLTLQFLHSRRRQGRKIRLAEDKQALGVQVALTPQTSNPLLSGLVGVSEYAPKGGPLDQHHHHFGLPSPHHPLQVGHHSCEPALLGLPLPLVPVHVHLHQKQHHGGELRRVAVHPPGFEDTPRLDCPFFSNHRMSSFGSCD